MKRQIGNYVIEDDGQAIPSFCVRMAGDVEYISTCHDSEAEAADAIKRYTAADERRYDAERRRARAGRNRR